MLLLTTTTDKIQLKTSSAAAVDWTSSYVDITTAAFTPLSTQGTVSSATTTDIVPAPAASTQRQIKFLSVRNRDASLSVNVTIIKNAAATAYDATGDIPLAPGESLIYVDGDGFIVYDANGARKSSGGGGGGGSPNISAGTTSNNLGTVVFSNSNGVSFGLNGSTITASVATSLTNMNLSAGTTSNNLSAVTFSNANNVSFGLNASTLTASASFPAQTNQTAGIYASSQTFGQSSSSTHDARSLTVVGSGGVSVGWSNSSLLISGQTTAAQTNQTAGIYASSQTFGQSSSSTHDARSLSIVGSGGVSVGWSNSSLLISGQTTAAQTNQTAGIYASSQTFGQSSSSTYDARSLSVVGSGGVSVGWSNSSLLISGTTYPAQSNQSAIKGLGASNTGNTAGNTGISTGIDWVIAGSNNITISESTVGGGPNTLWISGPTVGGAQTGISGIQVSNTTYTSGTVTFQNANGISFGSSGANGISASYTVPTQTNQTAGIYASSQTFGQSSSSTYDARSLSIVGSGGVSVGWSNSSLLISGQTTVAQTNQTVGIYGSSQTTGSASSGTYDARSLSFIGAGIISIGNHSTSAGGTTTGIIISASQSVQTQSNVQGIIVSNTTYRTGDVSFSNLNGISFGSNGANVVTASYTVPTQTNQTAGIYASSQTFGQSSSSTYDARSLSVVGSGGVSVGWSNSSLLISGTTYPAQSVQTIGLYASSQTTAQSSSSTVDARSISIVGMGIASVGLSAGSFIVSVPAGGGAGDGGVGIQVSNTTWSAGTITFQNANGISFGSSGASGVSASYTVPTQTNQTAGIYASSQTFGQSSSSTYDARSLTVVGSGDVSVGWSNSSLLISGSTYQTLAAQSFYHPYDGATTFAAVFGSGTIVVMPMLNVPDSLVVSAWGLLVSNSISTSSNSSHAGNVSITMGIYTRNGSTLSLLTSGSQSYQWTNTSNNSTSVIQGQRYLSVPMNFTASTGGDYWFAVGTRTSATNATWFSMSAGIVGSSTSRVDLMNVATNTSVLAVMGLGMYSAATTAMPGSIAFSQLSQNANRIPLISAWNFTA